MHIIESANTTATYQPKIKWPRIMLYIFLIVFTLIYMIPFFSALVTSVRTQDDISLNGFWSIPSEITFENYPECLESGRVNRIC